MSLTDLLRNSRNNIPSGNRSTRGHDSGGRRTRYNSARTLKLEPLEDRTLLAAYVVDTPLDHPLAGPSDVDGFVSLREAITAANTNLPFGDAPAGDGGGVVDEITFAPPMMGDTIVLGGVELTITDDVSITGPEADTGVEADQLVISGNSASRVFSIEADVNVSISKLAIVDGSAYEGGGIYNGGALDITNASFLNNSASHGGGIHNVGGTVTIADSKFTGNSAVGSGATGGAFSSFIHLSGPEGTLQVTDSDFSENSAASGGAIWSDISANIADCTFSENMARGSGGAIANRAATMTITDSTISGNDSGFYGGGIDNWGATLKLANSTVSGNSAGYDGGAIENDHANAELLNSTISGNSAGRFGGAIDNWVGTVSSTNSTIVMNRADADRDGSGSGGGIYNYKPSSPTLLNNTLLAGNLLGAAHHDSPNDLTGVDIDPGSSHNLIGDAATAGGLTDGVNGNIVGNSGGGTIDITTVLDPNLADNGGPTLTHALNANGPAVNAGDNSKAVDTEGLPLDFDQRGIEFARIADGTVDIGAFEVPPPPPPQLVQIDIKPGNDTNLVNLSANGVIALAIMTTADFDAASVDASTIRFAEADAVHSALEDVDGDGNLDMVLHFRVQDTNLADIYAGLLAGDINQDDVLDSNCQTAAISLFGNTSDGGEIFGSGEVDLFFSGKALRELLDELATAGVLEGSCLQAD